MAWGRLSNWTAKPATLAMPAVFASQRIHQINIKTFQVPASLWISKGTSYPRDAFL